MSRRYDCHATQCTWRPDSSDPSDALTELSEHAADSGHSVCPVCHVSLNPQEPVTCEGCISRARTMLRELTDLYALLDVELGQVGSAVYDRGSPSATDGDPLAHVDVLTLMARGAAGGVARRLPADRPYVEPRWWIDGRGPAGPVTRYEYLRLEFEAQGREHQADNLPDDPSSVDWWLASWEEQWSRIFGDERPDPTVLTSAGYLETRTRQMANDDPAGFGQYLTELRELLADVKRVTHRNERALRAPATCFDCGSKRLERTYTDPKPCLHVRISQRLLTWAADPERDLGARCETPLAREKRLETWERDHRRCQQGGLAEEWTCRACGRTYDQKSYFLAVSDRLHRTS
ncbi:MAG: hypothetical protein JWP14_3401 [Frankiales bacterium]|nr:hypothetical protein [Frankiales bacterium]